MNKPVGFKYFTEHWTFSNKYISRFTSKQTKEEKEADHIKACRKAFNCTGWSDEDIIKNTLIEKTEKPKSFPKFSNENPFKAKYGDRWIKNPKINCIQWTGWNWEYQLENIGHWYNFLNEKYLMAL